MLTGTIVCRQYQPYYSIILPYAHFLFCRGKRFKMHVVCIQACATNDTTEIFQVSLCKTFRSASESMKCVQQRLPHFMSLISIAQGESRNSSVVSFVNKGYDADLFTLLILAVSFPTARRVRNLHPFAACALCCRHIFAPSAVACDKLHLRANAHHWHVSAFLCSREFQGISCYTKKP